MDCFTPANRNRGDVSGSRPGPLRPCERTAPAHPLAPLGGRPANLARQRAIAMCRCSLTQDSCAEDWPPLFGYRARPGAIYANCLNMPISPSGKMSCWNRTKLAKGKSTGVKRKANLCAFRSFPSRSGLPKERHSSPGFWCRRSILSLTAKIRELVAKYDASTSAFFFACWQILLWRLTGESDFVVGLACDGRTYEDLQRRTGAVREDCACSLPAPRATSVQGGS